MPEDNTTNLSSSASKRWKTSRLFSKRRQIQKLVQRGWIRKSLSILDFFTPENFRDGELHFFPAQGIGNFFHVDDFGRHVAGSCSLPNSISDLFLQHGVEGLIFL